LISILFKDYSPDKSLKSSKLQLKPEEKNVLLFKSIIKDGKGKGSDFMPERGVIFAIGLSKKAESWSSTK
jgi:hypothetical protein